MAAQPIRLSQAVLAPSHGGRGRDPHRLEGGLDLHATYEQSGLVVSRAEQVVLEIDLSRRLAYTWHTFTSEWAAAHGIVTN